MACSACKQEPDDQYGKVNIIKFTKDRHLIQKDPTLPDSLPQTLALAPNLPPPTPPSKQNLPSLKEMAFNFSDAIKNNLLQAAKGGHLLASDEEAERRINICTACEFMIHNQSRCSKCGCFMNVKTRLQTSKCPVGKW